MNNFASSVKFIRKVSTYLTTEPNNREKDSLSI